MQRMTKLNDLLKEKQEKLAGVHALYSAKKLKMTRGY